MSASLHLVEKDNDLYVPEPAKIIDIKKFTALETFFRVQLLNRKSLNHHPGQFVQVTLLGIGEAPISISSPPDKNSHEFELCIRAVGDVTNKIHTLKIGDIIYIRGPYGHGFTDDILSTMQGKHILFIVGGIGYVPARSLINKILPHKDQYEKISILYGCKTPHDRMYVDELAHIAKMGDNVELLEIVDRADADWHGYEGVITKLIPIVHFNPSDTIAVIVGPPIMYKFVLTELLQKNMPEKNIYMSLERRMKCGVGKCGHCQMEGIYVCQEGPVFNYADVSHNEEVF
jgi:sulfhydrogenase subunit gamma (sulfur reductase)